MKNDDITDIYTYMRLFATDLGERILERYPALHQFNHAWPRCSEHHFQRNGDCEALADSTYGIGGCRVRCRKDPDFPERRCTCRVKGGHIQRSPWCRPIWYRSGREAFLTIPGIRVFLIDDIRTGGDAKSPHGINEVRLKSGMIVREGFETTLSDLRLRKQYASSRKR